MENKNLSSKVNEYIEYFRQNTNYPNILGRLFFTDSSPYYYDTGTNKVLCCSKVESRIIDKLLSKNIEKIKEIEEVVGKEELIEALSNIKYAIERDDILQVGGNLQFSSPGHFEELDKSLDTEVRQLVLELTGKCNLRCSYCIYSENYEGRRDFNDKEMSEEVAFKAIDYANAHGDKDGIAITFYGGEPLIKFDLLKKCIKYSQETIKDKKFTFSLTTNLTLMTKEIAEYLASVEGLSITCSIDGPKEIHDNKRKDINGNGSFDRAIRGLKYVMEAFGDKAEDCVSLSMVFSAPYSFEKLETINSFFDGLDWFPKGIRKNVSYPTESNIDYDEIERIEREQGEPINYLGDWSKEEYINKLKDPETEEFFTRSMVDNTLLEIHNRPIFVNNVNEINFNACCVPGSRKIYVSTNGDFQVCERIDGCPIIGNVNDGIDKNKIKEVLVEEYAEKSIDKCKNCWAVRLCGVCYALCFDNQKLDMRKKNFYCNSSREEVEESLAFYHKCLEANPKGIEYLNDYITKY